MTIKWFSFAVDVRRSRVRQLIRGAWASVIVVMAVSCLNPFVHGQELPTVLPANVRVIHFPSATLAEERTMLVMLPVDYDTAVRRYPVLYLLHGYDADITDWARGTNLSAYATQHQFIIVTPDASHSWYVNSVSNPKAHYDDYIMKDVIGYVDKNFRTIPEPFARAIAGVSMGGFGGVSRGTGLPARTDKERCKLPCPILQRQTSEGFPSPTVSNIPTFQTMLISGRCRTHSILESTLWLP